MSHIVDVTPVWHYVPDEVIGWEDGQPVFEAPHDVLGARSELCSPTLRKMTDAAGGVLTVTLAEFLDAVWADDPRPIGYKWKEYRQ